MGIAELSLMFCLSASTDGQQLKQAGRLEPKLELKGTVMESAYCSASNLRLTLQLAFRNTGPRTILLRKEGFQLGRYSVSRDLDKLRARRYELNVAPMMNSIAILKFRLEGKPTSEEFPFATIEPGAKHTVTTQVYIPFIGEAGQGVEGYLPAGDHLLQILVWTWLDSESFATQSRKKWGNQGFLWTKSVKSEPIPFNVAKGKTISPCP